MLAPLLLLGGVKPLTLLFVGNSLLNFNNVPATVAKLLETDGSGRKVTFQSHFVGHLEDVRPGSDAERDITSGRFDVVVLQGAMVSTSHRFTYPQDQGIALAKAAKANGARVLLYAEWPRRGIDETEYTLGIYRGIAKSAAVEIVPVGRAWDAVRKGDPRTELWQPDGNHATKSGSFVAAGAVYWRLADGQPTYRPAGVEPGFAARALKQARTIDRAWTSGK